MQLIKSFALVVAAVSGVEAQYGRPPLAINSPASLVQCQPTQLIWSGGQAPYFVAIIPGGQPDAQPLEDFGEQSGTSLTWDVNIAAGTSVTIELKDSTGAIAFSDISTIQEGPDNSCIGMY